MDSPSRSRKRGPEDQIDKQIESFEPENNKRSKASLGCILEPVPAGNPNFTGKLPANLASCGPQDIFKLVEERKKRSMMNSQSRREGEELPGTIPHESIVRQDSQTPANSNAGQDSITNHHSTFAVPISTRQEYQGIALDKEPDRPVSRMDHISSHNPIGRVGNHALQDYQMQLILLDQQIEKRRLMKKALEAQDTALRTITSLPNQLNIAHTSVKTLLENLPAYFKDTEVFKHSIRADIKLLQFCEEDLVKKGAEIEDLENRYNELIQMTPVAQQEELEQVKEKTMLTMQQDRERLRLGRDKTLGEVEEKNQRIAALEGALRRARELVPELIEDLTKLAPKLRDG